jgi:hypothetical protein
VEIINNLIEGLVDTCVSMLVMSITIIRKFGIMHLVFSLESYKTTSGVVIQAPSKINELLVQVGDVYCLMNFMVVNTNNYDIFLGLDFFIK